jgi:MSHA biogenesis protein MshK
MIGKNYRAAIISGQKILLGKKYELATLIRLNEHEAVLQNPDMTTQTLVMDYAIDKKVLQTTVATHAKKNKIKQLSKTK